VAEIQLASLDQRAGQDLAHQRAMGAVMEQLAERRQRLRFSVAEQAAGGRVRLDDDAALVGGEDAIRQRLEQRAGFLALTAQVFEASLELVMHRAERIDLV